MPEHDNDARARAFWSGTITFGLVSIPVLQVSFRFAGLDEARRYTFMKRFDLYMQRGGG